METFVVNCVGLSSVTVRGNVYRCVCSGGSEDLFCKLEESAQERGGNEVVRLVDQERSL